VAEASQTISIWSSAQRPSKTFQWLDVCEMASGGPLRLPVHVVAGAQPGPVVAIVATQHGNEVRPLGAVLEFVRGIDPAELGGTVVVLPIANPLAFEAGARCTWFDGWFGDNANLNRVWPGTSTGWLTEHLAFVISENIVSEADYLIDVHGESASMGIYFASVSTENSGAHKTANELAMAFGMEILVRGRPGARTLTGWALEIGKPAVAVELGYFRGWDRSGINAWARTPVEAGVTGFSNVLRTLGMLGGSPKLPRRQVIVESELGIGPKHGGLLFPEITNASIGETVPKGTVLGRVVSPYSFAELDVLIAPFDSTFILAAPHDDVCYHVNPGAGDYGFFVADAGLAKWMENS